jgi:hypothetical protein
VEYVLLYLPHCYVRLRSSVSKFLQKRVMNSESTYCCVIRPPWLYRNGFLSDRENEFFFVFGKMEDLKADWRFASFV